MSTLIGRLAQEKFASLIDQWLRENAGKIGNGGRSLPDRPARIAPQPHAPNCVPIRDGRVSNAANGANRALALDRNEFEAANERLCATLKRLAPRAGWLCEKPLYPRFEDAARIRLAGYACRLSGCVVNRDFLGFRKQRFVSFHTYSWSWDGTIDEEWLGEKIAEGKDRAYRLSDHRTPETRKAIGIPWVRED
jgi:hypothetical protein